MRAHGKNVKELDTYVTIRGFTNEAIQGTENLFDIGNGGVFDYDVSLVKHILAFDLFLDEIDTSAYPSHITIERGSALEIPKPDNAFDGVIMIMLLHHIVGKTVPESLKNIDITIREAIESYAQAHQIPLLTFAKGQRKDDLVAPYLKQAAGRVRRLDSIKKEKD